MSLFLFVELSGMMTRLEQNSQGILGTALLPLVESGAIRQHIFLAVANLLGSGLSRPWRVFWSCCKRGQGEQGMGRSAASVAGDESEMAVLGRR